MAEMNTEVGTETAAAPESGAEVQQDELRQDFDSEMLSQEQDDVPAQPTKGKTPPQKTVQPEKSPAAAQKPAAPADKATAEAQKSDLDEMVFGKEGFNPEKYTSFFNAKPQIGAYQPPIEAPKPGDAVAQPQTPEEKRRALIEERRTYQTNMQTSLLAYKQFYTQARNQGMSEQQADAQAEYKIREWLNDHMVERDFEMQQKEREDYDKQRNDELNTTRLQPVADANLALVSREFGGMERLGKLLTHKDLAGPYVSMIFEQANPGIKFKSQGEYAKAMDAWFVKVAQNPDNVRRLANIGFMAWKMRYEPQIHAAIKTGHDKSLLEAKRGKGGAPRTVVEHDRTPEGPDGLKTFFQSPGERARSQDES
jgi:hypothetical protein